MNTELTDAAIEQTLESHGLHVPHFTTSRNKMLSAVRAVIAADRAKQDARHLEELAAYELTVSNLRDAQGRNKHWHDTAWNRGHQMGMAANRDIARQATEALAKEREAHAETNRMMTEALTQAEAAQSTPDIHALFWQLRAKLFKLPRYSFLSPQGGGVVRVPDSCGRWIEADAAAWLCEVEEVDALIAAAPCAGCGETCKRAKLCATCAGEIAAAPQLAAQPELTDDSLMDALKKVICATDSTAYGKAIHDARAIIAAHEAKKGGAA